MLASAVLGLAAVAQPTAAQVPVATWTGGPGSPGTSWESANAWAAPGVNNPGPPTDTAIFPANASKMDVDINQAATTIGTLQFLAPGYSLNVNGSSSTLTIFGLGILTGSNPFVSPENRPIVNIGTTGNVDTVAFVGESTGGLARFNIGGRGTLDISGRSIKTDMTAGAIDNGGLINLASSNIANVGNQLTVFGTYMGNNGVLRLNTFLGTDSSPSDKLIIDGGATPAGTRPIAIDGPATATGTTRLQIINAGGPGAQTTANGIEVVEAKNGGTTTPTAFSLPGGFVSAGAYDYFLFRGGITQGTQDSWFLRNERVCPPGPGPGGAAGGPGPGGAAGGPEPIPTPTPAPGTPPLPACQPGAPANPLFRPEVAVESVLPTVARELITLGIGTFNERQGDQLLLRGDMRVGAWGRVFGQQKRENFAQGAQPDFNGSFAGFQVGSDLWRFESANGHSDHIGFYVTQARASGSVHGSVDGFQGALAGHVDLDASSYGAYWTHLGPSNWYIDALVQGSYLLASPSSIRSLNSNNFSGSGYAASIEAGYPIALASWLAFEPQVQGIWQRVSFNSTVDPVSTITFDNSVVFTGRAGALLRGTFGAVGTQWQPYLKGNVWWGTNGFDTVFFGIDPVQTGRQGGTAVEGGGGVTGRLTRNVGVYCDASYLTAVSGESRIAIKGNVGLRVTW